MLGQRLQNIYSSHAQSKLFALLHNDTIGKTCHPETAVDNALDRHELVFRGRIDQPQETLHECCCLSVTLKVDQQLATVDTRKL